MVNYLLSRYSEILIRSLVSTHLESAGGDTALPVTIIIVQLSILDQQRTVSTLMVSWPLVLAREHPHWLPLPPPPALTLLVSNDAGEEHSLPGVHLGIPRLLDPGLSWEAHLQQHHDDEQWYQLSWHHLHHHQPTDQSDQRLHLQQSIHWDQFTTQILTNHSDHTWCLVHSACWTDTIISVYSAGDSEWRTLLPGWVTGNGAASPGSRVYSWRSQMWIRQRWEMGN